jgi:serine/threonine protein phosphatase PrpC
MVENSPQPSASETLKPSQISTVARLGSRQDAVCAGKDVHLGFVERSPGGTARIKKDQERKASEVAFLLGQAGATKDGDPYTADDILGLGEKVKQLTNESGPYAGVLIQAFDADVIGSRSAAQLTVAIHELERASQKVPGTPDKTQDQILEEVEKAVREFNKKNDPSKGDVTELAIALVDKKGNVSGGIGTENLRMVVIDTDGKKEDVIPGYKLKPGQKIIIGEKTKIGSLKSTDTKGKSLDDIVGSAVGNTAETRAASGMAAEKDNGTPQIEKKKKVEVKVAQAARAPLKNETPPNNKESEDRIFSEGAFAGVIDGAGGYARGGEAAEAVRDGLAKMVRGEAFTVTDSDGNVFNIPNGEPMNFDGLTQAQVEARLKNIAINLNRIIRSEDTRPAAAKAKDPGPSACMAVGNIHLNEKGELTLSYLNVGDSEIAIIRGGKVILVPNDSVRNKANKESPPNIDFYLNEREAAVRLADGKATKKLGDQVNVGSIPLQEGDRVVYLTDGVAEDLQNIRGIMAADGKVTPTAGDPTPIALDILGQIDPNTPVENMPQAILKLLDDVRQKNGIKITRHSNTYNSDIDRKMVPQGDLNIVVGGKGATQDRGYDDGESVVVVEAHVKLPPTDPPKPKEVIVPDKVVVHEDDKTAKVKVSEYIQTPEYKQNVEWFKRVLEEVKNAPAGDPDVDALKQKPGETPLDYAKRVAPALRTYLNEESKHANSPLSQIAAKAEDTSSGNNPDRNDELTSLHAIEVVLNRAPGLYDSSFGVEVGGNPEQIKADFKEAFEIYEAGMADLEARKDNLSPSEKEEYARYKYTKEIYHRNESDPNWQHEVELRAYGQKPQHFIQEGVPVDGIMDYLTAQITVARAANRDADVQKYTRLFATLKDSSDFYVNIPLKNRRERKIPGVTRFTTKSQLMEARHQLEAERRSVDPLRTSTKPNDTERMQEDWDRGVNDMKRRRELIVPEKTKKELGEIYRKKTNENADPNKVLTELADLDPAPENERKKGPDPEPAPTNDDDEPHPPRPRPPTPTPLTDNDLKAQVVVAAENGHYIHSNNNNTDHTMALIETSGTHWYSRIPLLGGVLGSVFHPVQNIWRNGLARESVREQHRRFNDRMSIILKSHFMEGVGADGQMRIPVELTSQLIDKSIAEGRKLIKEQGFFTRLGWAARNIVARTTTLGETAEMHFAKQWLEDNLVENKPGSRDASIEAIYRRALDEQNSVGSRIALGGMRRGEKREVVANSPLEAPIKSAIAAYFAEMDRLSTETDTEKKNKLIAYAKTALVAQINTIGKTEDSGSSIDLNKGIELASNILSVVDDLSKTFGNTEKSKWKVLNEQNKWGDFKLNIIAAESRWGGEGGAESIRTGSLREKVLQRMAERELFVGENERTHGVQMASLSILSDVVTYGDAYLLGMSTSAALFGANAASKVIGGLGGIMGMSAAKEMGLRIGGTEIFKGRYRGEVAQLSREMALGKKSPADAKIRGEMGGALVNAETVDVIAGRIEPLLAKDPATLTEREAFLLLKEIAQLDARMRIADISGTKDLQFTVQNYIIYNEMQKNEQYLRLKSAVLKGLTNLTTYKTQYVDFGGTDPLTSGVELAYGKSQTNMGLFEKFSALAEAQLRVGSRTEVLKWLQDENGVFNNNAGLGMSKDEAKTLVNTFYNEAKGTVKQEQSIRSKEKVLRKLALKRAATIVVQSALIMPIGGAIYGAEAQLFQGIGQEVQHAIREGIPTWSGEWGALLNGSATPLHPPTIFQEGVLTVRHTIDHVVPAVTPPHDEVIDNVHVQLPARYHYERIPQGQPGAGNDRIIDVIDGHVVKDLSNVGLRIDAQGHLIEVDGRGNIINNDAIADFHASGIELHQLGTTTETLLSPTTGTITSTVDGQNVQIPTGTHWVRDSSGNNDLVLDVNPNMILVDNAHVLNGQLTADHFYHSAAANTIDVQQNGTNIPGSSINGSSVWDKAGDYRFVWAKDNTHLGAVHDYIYKTNDAAHPYAVEMKFPGDAIIHNPNTGVDESLNAAFQDGRAGMLYNIPGHGQIFVPSHEVDAQGWIVNRLDP